MGPTHSRRPGNTSARTNAPDSDDDDCIMLEVLVLLPLSYVILVMSVSADQGRQVLEHVTPLDAEVGDPPVRRSRQTPASDALASNAGPSAEPAPKCQKILSSGPPRKKKKNEIPVSSK
jgi:hypothetical protein